MASQVSEILEPWCNLDGKVVMVTGASSGLGREFCLDLAKAGCKIVAAARRMDRLMSLCDQINQSTSPSPSTVDSTANNTTQAVAIELDVAADGRAIEASVKKSWDAFGRIDVLVNNAGLAGKARYSLDLSEEDWNIVIKTNLIGALSVSKYVGKRMRALGRGGSIINISSAGGLNRPIPPGCTAYASSKAAMDTMTRVMALELGPYKIRVNSIAAGLFLSEITKVLMQKEWLKNVILRTVPLKTIGTSDPALTTLVRYLIHDSSNYVSGNIFIVDAGVTLVAVPIFSSL